MDAMMLYLHSLDSILLRNILIWVQLGIIAVKFQIYANMWKIVRKLLHWRKVLEFKNSQKIEIIMGLFNSV